MKKSCYDMIYLLGCAVNSITPQKEKIGEMNLDKLFDVCQFHSLTSIVCTALESAGLKPSPKWLEAKAKAIRKVMLHDAERKNILKFMEENGIWYMPMKGVILKDLYPRTGMRQMTDNDILYDERYQNNLYRFMVGRGYKPKHVGKGCDDVYMKEPVYNFEMHRKLFQAELFKKISDYYSDPQSLTVSDGKSKFGRKFTDEDFYIYITAHEYKHYVYGGTGIRSLLDCYVFLKAKQDNLNWEYIECELEKLGIKEYEKKSGKLAMKVFSSDAFLELSEDEAKELSYYLNSGTYGTVNKFAENKIKIYLNKSDNKSGFGYILSRIFPPMSFYKEYYSFCYKTRILIPFAWAFRLIRGVTVRKNIAITELNAVKKIMN